MIFTNRVAFSRLSRQVADLDQKLDLIMAHLGIDVPQPMYPVVVSYLRSGEKILAIKAFRDATGTGLADAKREVEAIARGLGLR